MKLVPVLLALNLIVCAATGSEDNPEWFGHTRREWIARLKIDDTAETDHKIDRINAAKILAQHAKESSAAVPALFAALNKEKDDETADYLLKALLAIGFQGAAPPASISEISISTEKGFQRMIRLALALRRDAEPLLASAAKSESEPLRLWACAALEELTTAGRDAVPSFTPLLDSKKEREAARAASALISAGTFDVVLDHCLKALAAGGDDETRVRYLKLIGTFAPAYAKIKSHPMPRTDEVITHVRPLIASMDEPVASTALKLLVDMGDRVAACEQLLKLLDEADEDKRRIAIIRLLGDLPVDRADFVVPRLIAMLKSTNMNVRVATAISLGHYQRDANSAIEPLEKAFEDDPKFIRPILNKLRGP